MRLPWCSGLADFNWRSEFQVKAFVLVIKDIPDFKFVL